MVLNNLTNFNTQLQSKMLFSVDAMLSPPDIIVSPPYNELFKHLMQVWYDRYKILLNLRRHCALPYVKSLVIKGRRLCTPIPSQSPYRLPPQLCTDPSASLIKTVQFSKYIVHTVNSSPPLVGARLYREHEDLHEVDVWNLSGGPTSRWTRGRSRHLLLPYGHAARAADQWSVYIRIPDHHQEPRSVSSGLDTIWILFLTFQFIIKIFKKKVLKIWPNL